MPTGWVPSLLWVSRAGTTDLRCTWRPCWTLPVSDWVVWVLASPPQQPFPLIQQTNTGTHGAFQTVQNQCLF